MSGVEIINLSRLQRLNSLLRKVLKKTPDGCDRTTDVA